MKDRIVNSLLAHLYNINESDEMLGQFYGFFFVWMQQLGS